MTERHTKAAEILLEIEAEMRRISLWSEQKPADDKLSSELPFCYDTLAVEQWLQWIFIPRMRRILEQNLDLPTKCDIHPYAEEFLTDRAQDTVQLLALIKRFDELFA
jgi:uncharacterized protein YqcC (DUF446 family)